MNFIIKLLINELYTLYRCYFDFFLYVENSMQRGYNIFIVHSLMMEIGMECGYLLHLWTMFTIEYLAKFERLMKNR